MTICNLICNLMMCKLMTLYVNVLLMIVNYLKISLQAYRNFSNLQMIAVFL